MKFISVIVTTYNWPLALRASLSSLLDQQDKNFEIIIADDGSGNETKNLINEFSQLSPISIKHVHHKDRGFRAGTIRNKAVAISIGEYLIFIDGDCAIFPNFIQRHRHLAEQGFFVPGNRMLLAKSFSLKTLNEQKTIHNQSIVYFLALWLGRNVNRITPFIYNPFSFLRYRHPKRWIKAMTSNLAMFKNDFLTVNGFDEEFEGWGYEDSDLVIRLIHSGVKRKEGRFAVPVLHYWHNKHDRSKHDVNYERLVNRIKDESFILAIQGIDKYLL